jgi:hypothetical protein
MGKQKEGNIGIFTGLPESMAGWIVRQAKDVLLQIRQRRTSPLAPTSLRSKRREERRLPRRLVTPKLISEGGSSKSEAGHTITHSTVIRFELRLDKPKMNIKRAG